MLLTNEIAGLDFSNQIFNEKIDSNFWSNNKDTCIECFPPKAIVIKQTVP